MPAPRAKPQYFIVEHEQQSYHDNVAAALEEAKVAHERDRTRRFAVVQLVATVDSEHKTIVTRVR